MSQLEAAMDSLYATMDQYQHFIRVRTYSRFLHDKQRRETWPETVQRYIDFFSNILGVNGDSYRGVLQNEVYPAILNLEVMPSMRALTTAGPALARENLAGYNCAYLAVDCDAAFSEALYVLMCGTGVGFTCERQEITKLPLVPENFIEVQDTIVVDDSKEGWAKAFRALLFHLRNGDVPRIDYSLIRPAGAILKTFGGRASGPEPLRKLFNFTIKLFRHAAGRKLQSLEVNDLMCMIGEIVVVGGVRRSAMISLSNLSDMRMRDAKSGNWWSTHAYRALANNSVAYTEKPSSEIFLEEWLALIKSKAGERGIFNRKAAQKQAAKWGRRDPDAEYGCNPCSEIILLIMQLCNLSEVVVRASDTLETLKAKVRIAAIMGTFQATLTNFQFVRKEWAENTASEALLGVSLTGIMDHPMMNGSEGHAKLKVWLNVLRDHARDTNAEWAAKLGIPESAAITCVKPSGTVSQLVNSASGIHSRHSEYYNRTVRVDKKDPVYALLKDSGLYIEDHKAYPETTAVVYFPTAAPKGAVTRNTMTAIEALDLWLLYQEEWCEHKPSVSITVREHEWVDVGAWVYKNFDVVSGISFYPADDVVYEQAPYQDLTEEEYNQWLVDHPTPVINWDDLQHYEKEDNTVSSQTLACAGGSCEIH